VVFFLAKSFPHSLKEQGIEIFTTDFSLAQLLMHVLRCCLKQGVDATRIVFNGELQIPYRSTAESILAQKW